MLWLALYFPLLPLQVFTRAETDNARPTLISEQNRVLCADPAAAEAGIKPGLAVATAGALQPALRIIARDAGKEQAALRRLAHWCYQFSPTVSPKPPDLLLLEIEGCLQLFGGITELRKRIDTGLGSMGFSSRQGLGDTPKAAELFARSQIDSGITNPGSPAYQQALRQIPLGYLDTPPKQRQLLREMGLSRLGELLDLPPHAVGRRFGRDFLGYLQRLSGEQPDPLPALTPPPDFHSELFYIEGIEDKEGLLFPIKRLLQELCEFLRTRQLDCRRLHWEFVELHHRPQPLTIRLSRAQNSLSAFLEITRIRLERLLLPTAVHSLALRAGEFSAARPRFHSLFPHAPDNGQNDSQSTLKLLPDKLSARLGSRAVHRLRAGDEHPPERAWQALPLHRDQRLSGRQHSNQRYSPDPSPQAAYLLRPFWLLPEPAPIRQRRRQLFWQGRLTLLRGPERIDNGWWRPPRIQRDYFIARHDNGSLYWVFRTPHDRRWFVHGLFY